MTPDQLKRFLAKIEMPEEPDGCWVWIACKNKKGYGQFGLNGKARLAHRVAYEHYVGPIPDGMEPDHTCRVRACVNFNHLEPVTHRVNILRGASPCAKHARKTHCKNGHLLSGDNLVTSVLKRGHRLCRTCHCKYLRKQYHSNPESCRERARQYRKRRREQLSLTNQ